LDRRLNFSPGQPSQHTEHIDLARHKTLDLCSRELPQTSLTAHGRLVCATSAPRSIVHDAIPSASSIYCPTELVLQHLSFQLRGFDDALVHLYGHQVSFVLEIIRPYEQ
jgi:hypothetical protein